MILRLPWFFPSDNSECVWMRLQVRPCEKGTQSPFSPGAHLRGPRQSRPSRCVLHSIVQNPFSQHAEHALVDRCEARRARGRAISGQYDSRTDSPVICAYIFRFSSPSPEARTAIPRVAYIQGMYGALMRGTGRP
jgi:hypothetical protein